MKAINEGAAIDGRDMETRVIGEAAIGRDPDGRTFLVGARCRSCREEMVPPVAVCPVCGGEELDRCEQPGEGELYTYTVLHVGASRWRRPLLLGYVDLTNGVRVFSQLEGDDFRIGDTVTFGTAIIGQEPDGAVLSGYVFRKKENA